MKDEFTFKLEHGTRVNLDAHEGGAWLSLITNNARMHTVFTRAEAQQLANALQTILEQTQ